MILANDFKNNLDFSGKTVLITGGAKGIGRAIAEQFAAFNANIILFDLDNAEGKKTADIIRKDYKVSSDFICTDLQDMANIKSSAQEALKISSIEILVNNAGIGILEPAIECTEKIWDMTFAINTKAAFFLSQMIGKSMIEKGYGKIVNMASQAGIISLKNHVAYSATKAAIISMTKSLAFEWAQYGISVNAISPTVVLTELGKMNWEGSHGDDMKAKIPNGRFAMPEEVAYLAAFLASDGASMINGANILIDGGYTIW